ncbi:MAG: phosphotransferase enzyme family protein [Gammaproteobacteria bacterium]
MTHRQYPTDDILAEYNLQAAGISPLGNGLINLTWKVEAPPAGRFVLQRVNDMFSPAINRDIDRLTRHLEAAGEPTCRLVPTRDGALWVTNDAGNWRLLTWVDGVSHDALKTAAQARCAGGLLARFHRAVDNLDHEFATRRPGIHDTQAHLRFLTDTLKNQVAHPQHRAVASLGRRILEAAEALPELPAMPDRVVHGDPKINNILFRRDSDEAICLIDLDTITHMPLSLELGDAMRSWCNPASEDDRYGEFSAALFCDAMEGYAEFARGWIEPAEREAIVDATRTILIELAARFCADALNESYFGWNPERFASRTEHNQVRAAGQLTVVESLVAQRADLEAIIAAAFAG